jgi:hypothetical protein
MPMEQSILNSTKKILNVDPANTSFDLDILTHINAAFSHLQQLGIGPEEGFIIEDEDAVWDDFVSAPAHIVSAVKTNVYLRVRLLFDPPTVSHVLTAMQQQLQESDGRLSIMRESTEWVSPVPEPDPVGPDI